MNLSLRFQLRQRRQHRFEKLRRSAPGNTPQSIAPARSILGVSAGTKSKMRVISRIFVPAGTLSANSTTTPTIAFFRNGTSTRLPGCRVPHNASGIA